MAIERRRLSRFDLEMPVAVSVLDKSYEVLEVLEYTIRDISAGGTYLQNRKAFATGTPVEVSFFLPVGVQEKIKSKKSHVRVSGLVVRVDQRGMGVCFDEDYEIEPFL